MTDTLPALRDDAIDALAERHADALDLCVSLNIIRVIDELEGVDLVDLDVLLVPALQVFADLVHVVEVVHGRAVVMIRDLFIQHGERTPDSVIHAPEPRRQTGLRSPASRLSY